ncbi:MAG: hypothetical protein ACRCYJ_11620 [Plesiomonas shigelloides]
MLKPYHDREKTLSDAAAQTVGPTVSSVAASVEVTTPHNISGADEDGVILRYAPQQCARLANYELLKDLPSFLTHLSTGQRSEVIQLISDFPSLFSDAPRQTNVLYHDINVNGARPIKQHSYRVNAFKRSVMRQEVGYLLENGAPLVCSFPSLMEHLDSAPITKR